MKNLLFTSIIISTLSLPLSASMASKSHFYIYQDNSIHPKDLPQNIRKHITDNYNGAEINKAFKDSDGYEVIIRYEGKKVSLKYDSKGNFLRKT